MTSQKLFKKTHILNSGKGTHGGEVALLCYG